MQNFQDIFETHKRSFISDFSICMTVPLTIFTKDSILDVWQGSEFASDSNTTM